MSVLLAANNGSDEQQSAIFWWDGKAIGWVRSPTQIDVGRVCGLYTTTPLLNFTASEIQGMMEAGWAGGPIPPGYTSPVHPDSGVD